MKYLIQERFYNNRLEKPVANLDEFIVFEYDSWNDYNYLTSFHVHYHKKNKRKKIGEIKIANVKESEINYENNIKKSGVIYETFNNIKREFGKLPAEFVSIGNEDYYEELYKIFGVRAEEILNELNDIAYDLEKYEKVSNYQVVTKSLLREITDFTFKNNLHSLSRSGKKYADYNFTLMYTEKNRKLSQIDFSTDYKALLPNNIHAIIGKNGTGKTTILNDLVHAGIDDKLEFLSKFSSDEKKYNANIITDDNNVKSLYDFFESILYISFSAFDNFNNIVDKNTKKFSYVGLYNHESDISPNIKGIKEDFSTSIEKIIGKKDKAKLFGESIEYLDIISGNPIIEAFRTYGNDDEIINTSDRKKNGLQTELETAKENLIKEYDNFSSGYKIILLSIANLVEKVNHHTLVIFDEPELYLHPPLISNFMRAISRIMKKKNGICIMATHSPVILQEIPKKCVNIISRNNDQLFENKRPKQETFGENISTLTDKVFGLDIERSGFYRLISDIIDNPRNYNEYKEKISEVELGRDAELYLRILKNRKSN